MVTMEEKKRVRAACKKILIGHKQAAPSEELAAIAAWCAEQADERDVYGDGPLIQAFEAKIAALLGKEAAVFMPSGTMAQQIALRIYADRSPHRGVGLHATSHLELHEQRGYAHLHDLKAVTIGERQRAIRADDLGPAPLAALVVELPQREIGGVLPTWAELEALKKRAAERGIKLHMDGARLWETQAFYARSLAEIACGFDSVYVSCYKGLGGLGGALLAGPQDFVAESRIWLRRHGGNLVTLHPYVASAAMNLERRLAQMPQLYAHAQTLAAAAFGAGARVAPYPPQANMFHVHLEGDPAALDAAHLTNAEATGLWLTGRFTPGSVPGWASFEVYVGDNALAVTGEELAAALGRLVTAGAARAR